MEGSELHREADIAPAQSTDPTSGGFPVFADAGPLGLAAFALTTFVLSMINANLVGAGAAGAVLGLALLDGGLAQIITGIVEFRSGNTFGAVAFTSYGGFWLSFWYYLTYGAKTVPPSEAHAALGLYLWAWAIFTLYMTIVALRTTGAVAVVFILLTLTFIFLAIGNSGGDVNMVKVGGYLGIATAIAAWYTSFAGVINATWGRTVLPVFPVG